MPYYQSEYVRCGKVGCRRCPHGPYWYEYWSEGEGDARDRRRRRYCGRVDPRTVPPDRPGPTPAVPHPHESIHCRQTATRALACEILGIPPSPITADGVRRAYRRLALLHHPDRGGDPVVMARINSAYSYLMSTLHR